MGASPHDYGANNNEFNHYNRAMTKEFLSIVELKSICELKSILYKRNNVGALLFLQLILLFNNSILGLNKLPAVIDCHHDLSSVCKEI